MDLKNFDVTEIKRLHATGKVTNTEIFDYFFERYEKHNASVNAIYGLDKEKILRMLDKAPAEKCLIPLPTKELSEVKGEPTFYGSETFQNNIANFTRDSIEMLFQNGFYNFGRSKSCEFGLTPHTISNLHGTTNNPWDTDKNSGGSSGGAAAAVASGIAPIAHASDGGGSIRIPAAICGQIGFKPSRGRLPCGPQMSFSFLSTGGVISKSVRDQIDIYKNIWYPQHFGDWTGPIRISQLDTKKKLKIGFLSKAPFCDLTTDTANEKCLDFIKNIENIDALNVEVEQLTINHDNHQLFFESFITLWASLLNSLPLDKPFEKGTKYLMDVAIKATARDLQLSINALSQVSKSIFSQIKGFDFIISPALPGPPISNSELLNPDVTLEQMIQSGFETTPYTPWVNVMGLPAITIPTGFWSSGTPFACQILCTSFEDEKLLQFAEILETEVGYIDLAGKNHRVCPIAPGYI